MPRWFWEEEKKLPSPIGPTRGDDRSWAIDELLRMMGGGSGRSLAMDELLSRVGGGMGDIDSGASGRVTAPQPVPQPLKRQLLATTPETIAMSGGLQPKPGTPLDVWAGLGRSTSAILHALATEDFQTPYEELPEAGIELP